MTPKFWERMLCGFLAVILALGAVGCGVIVEEEEKETEIIVETDALNENMVAVIDENLTVLASAVNNPWHEQSCIDVDPGLFEQIIAFGEEAIPYLMEIGEAGTEYYKKDEDAYLRCVLAYQAAYQITPSLFEHPIPSPDNRYTLNMVPYSFMYIGDPIRGIIYNVHLIYNKTGQERTVVRSVSSGAVMEWSDNYRYAIFCDRPHKYSSTTGIILDTEKYRGTGVNTSFMMEYYSNYLGSTCLTHALRYQHMDNGDLIFWFGIEADDGTVITGKVAASFSQNVFSEYTVQEDIFSEFVDTIPAHTGDGEPIKHYWYKDENVWTVTKNAEGYFTMKTDSTIGYMIRQQKEGEA